MASYSQEFKVQSVEKALSRRTDQTLNTIADDLRIGYSTLQRWIHLAKKNKLEKTETSMSKEKSPQNWTKSQRLEAVMDCHGLNEGQLSFLLPKKWNLPTPCKGMEIRFFISKSSI